MGAQDKKRLPDIVDKLREIDIGNAFLEENRVKYNTILDFFDAKLKTLDNDVFSVLIAFLKAMGIKDIVARAFNSGYILGYEYGKYRTEKLNAQNKNIHG